MAPPLVRVDILPCPNVAGLFVAPPLGIILHGSRSEVNRPTYNEYIGTAQYCQLPQHGLGWNITAGPGVYARHYSARHWGWNAREHSSRYLACEFAQPTVNHPIGDDQVGAFAAWVREEVWPAWPTLDVSRDDALPTHAELPAGKRDGKSDTFPEDDARTADLRRRIRRALAL